MSWNQILRTLILQLMNDFFIGTIEINKKFHKKTYISTIFYVFFNKLHTWPRLHIFLLLKNHLSTWLFFFFYVKEYNLHSLVAIYTAHILNLSQQILQSSFFHGNKPWELFRIQSLNFNRTTWNGSLHNIFCSFLTENYHFNSHSLKMWVFTLPVYGGTRGHYALDEKDVCVCVCVSCKRDIAHPTPRHSQLSSVTERLGYFQAFWFEKISRFKR